jgi:hypothetical protein
MHRPRGSDQRFEAVEARPDVVLNALGYLVQEALLGTALLTPMVSEFTAFLPDGCGPPPQTVAIAGRRAGGNPPKQIFRRRFLSSA